MADHSRMVAGLQAPGAYPPGERPQRVEMVETHISWLFLTGRFAYKVKKPVDFGFLDFTTPERRRHYCHQEVALNRRMSPQVYLGVVEVREQDGHYAFGGPGRTVDYAVKMRQLPRQRALGELLRQGLVDQETVRRVAMAIWQFHEGADRGEAIAAAGGLETVRLNARENFQQTEGSVGVAIPHHAYRAIRAYTEGFMEAMEPLFLRRASEGRIRDCHGDLHAAQVFLDDGVQVIDCIEFNERFRYCDVASDLAFLAMDLDHHGRPDLSTALVDAYVEASGDTELPRLMDFYKCYRAYVRGKVEGFRLGEPSLPADEREGAMDRSRRYFDLAWRYARPPRPLLLITAGLMGTGKTTLASGLAEATGALLVSSDVLRKEMAGLPPTERHYDAWDTGLYTPEAVERTYQEMHARAASALAQGRPVVLDASYRRASWRLDARRVAREHGVPFLALECSCPAELVRRRLLDRSERRDIPSDGRWEVYDRQRASFEPLEELAPGETAVADTSGQPEEALEAALHAAYRSWLEHDAAHLGGRQR